MQSHWFTYLTNLSGSRAGGKTNSLETASRRASCKNICQIKSAGPATVVTHCGKTDQPEVAIILAAHP